MEEKERRESLSKREKERRELLSKRMSEFNSSDRHRTAINKATEVRRKKVFSKIAKLEEVLKIDFFSTIDYMHNVESKPLKTCLNYLVKSARDKGMDIKSLSFEFVKREMKSRGYNVWKIDRSKLMKERNNKNWSDSSYREKMTEFLKSEELNNLKSEFAKNQWKDREYRNKILKSGKNKNTSIELEVQSILQELNVPFDSDGVIRTKDSVILPDIKLDNKKVIEVHGDYFHANPVKFDRNNLDKIQTDVVKRDREKEELYKSYGYDLLVIWEYDLKNNKDKVINDIKNFLK